MTKKFFAVATFAFAMAFAVTAGAVNASDIYTPASGLLQVGSGMGAKAYQAPNVMAAQKALNACQNSNIAEDGKFGPITAGLFKTFQTAKGIKIDGIIGSQTAATLAACSGGVTTTPTTPTTTLSGGAGELDYSSTTTGLESDVKEGATEKVLATKLEADGSDIGITSVKVSFENNSGNGSTRLNKYIEEVSVMLGSKEVGSADPEDFSKDGDVYSESIALSGAVVDEDEKANLYVVVTALDTVDDDTADFDGIITQVRWTDATGATFSDSDSDGSDFGSGATQTFGFDEASVDDDIAIKSSSSDPDAATLLVDADTESDEHLVGVFKLDVDEDSSDITVSEFPILVTFDDADDTTGTTAEDIISEVRVEIDGEDYTATLEDDEVVDGDGDAAYLIDDEFTIDAGDVVDVKIYVTFNDQDGNYGLGTTFTISTDETVSEVSPTLNWSAEGEDELAVTGTYSGEEHTLQTAVADVTAKTATIDKNDNGDTGTISFEFTVDNSDGDEDFTFDVANVADVDGTTDDVMFTLTGTDTTIAVAALTLVDGDADYAGSTYTIASGDSATFVLDTTFTTVDSGDNGTYRVRLDSVGGVTVDKISSGMSLTN